MAKTTISSEFIKSILGDGINPAPPIMQSKLHQHEAGASWMAHPGEAIIVGPSEIVRVDLDFPKADMARVIVQRHDLDLMHQAYSPTGNPVVVFTSPLPKTKDAYPPGCSPGYVAALELDLGAARENLKMVRQVLHDRGLKDPTTQPATDAAKQFKNALNTLGHIKNTTGF